MTVRERSIATFFNGPWEAICQEPGCDWHPAEGVTSRNPKFRSARLHAVVSGHTVLVRHVQEWEISRKEEASAEDLGQHQP